MVEEGSDTDEEKCKIAHLNTRARLVDLMSGGATENTEPPCAEKARHFDAPGSDDLIADRNTHLRMCRSQPEEAYPVSQWPGTTSTRSTRVS